MVFYAQGGSREVQGWKGAVQGSQMDPLDGPIAGLVEGHTFFRTPLFGYGAIDPPKGGSEKKYRPRPNRLWGRPKGPFGTPEPHLSGPVLPWIPPNGDRRGLMVSAPTAHRVDLGSIPSFGQFRIGQFFRKNRMLYNQKKWLLHIRRRGTSANFRSGHRAMTARNNKATNRDSKLSSRKCRQ